MMKFTKKRILINIAFLLVIGMYFYPPSREYITRMFSFSPSKVSEEKQESLKSYNWSLNGVNTTDVELESLKGKVVFLNIWATWCPPCRAEIPSIQKLYNDYKDKITFVFVSNEKQDVIQQFYTDNGYDLPTYNPKIKAPEQLQVSSIPSTFIIDKNGKIVVEKRGPADWNSTKMRTLLDDLIQE